jgi:hypothetical protein
VNGIATGTGCVYPPTVGNIATQLRGGRTHVEGLHGVDGPARASIRPWARSDPNVVATPTSLYATRHNPFVYFQAITDSPAARPTTCPSPS